MLRSNLDEAANQAMRGIRRMERLAELEAAIDKRGKQLGMGRYATHKVYEAARRELLAREAAGPAGRPNPRSKRLGR